jgi:4-hydroxy-2-oxoheptanedioate aldolase
MLRLKEIILTAGVGMSAKIGGCEALTDARLARDYGVSIMMSPMIESRFALEKFLTMADAVFPAEEQEDTKFMINIETIDGYQKIDQILDAENLKLLDGIVLGRTDLASALKTDDVDCPEMLAAATKVFRKAREKSLRCIVGGGITGKTIPFLTELGGLIDGYETRKVVLCGDLQDPQHLREGIRLALRFEYLWYELRQKMYLQLAKEDSGRMKKIAATLA